MGARKEIPSDDDVAPPPYSPRRDTVQHATTDNEPIQPGPVPTASSSLTPSDNPYSELRFSTFSWDNTDTNQNIKKKKAKIRRNRDLINDDDDIEAALPRPSAVHEPRGKDCRIQETESGGLTNDPDYAPMRTQEPPEMPMWLEYNLLAAKITVILLFVVALANLSFAGVMMEDLRNDTGDYSCEYHYIANASEPPPGRNYLDQGRYHGDCVLLFRWTYLLTVAGAFSIIRALMQGLPVYRPSYWTIRYSDQSWASRFFSPARVMSIRTFFSLIPSTLYLASAIILGTSRLITGPRADDSYWQLYITCLALTAFSAAASIHQMCSTGLAGWFLRGYKRGETGWGLKKAVLGRLAERRGKQSRDDGIVR